MTGQKAPIVENTGQGGAVLDAKVARHVFQRVGIVQAPRVPGDVILQVVVVKVGETVQGRGGSPGRSIVGALFAPKAPRLIQILLFEAGASPQNLTGLGIQGQVMRFYAQGPLWN